MSEQIDSLHRFYEALAGGDEGAASDCLAPDVEWSEPTVPGYPPGGLHSGADAVADAVLDVLIGSLTLERIVGDEDHAVATGAFAVGDQQVAFAHVCELRDGLVTAVRSFPDTSAFTTDAVRAELAELADQLLEEAEALRRQWEELASEGDETVERNGDAPPGRRSTRSIRLEAVDLAQDGAARGDVEIFLAGHLNDAAAVSAILDDIFPANGAAPAPAAARFPWTRR